MRSLPRLVSSIWQVFQKIGYDLFLPHEHVFRKILARIFWKDQKLLLSEVVTATTTIKLFQMSQVYKQRFLRE